MIDTAMIFNSSFYGRQAVSPAKRTPDTEGKVSFQARMADAADKTQKRVYPSAVEEYKSRHPEYASMVDGQVRSGRKVLRANGAENVDRDSMTMEEYKQFFTALMDSIPYDFSQVGDVNIWSVTEKGWEQMKNDPDYEAWVLGYTSQDRSFHNSWAALPGFKHGYHTEQFGASIDEHLGQSFPAGGEEEEEDGETWWEKRHKKMVEMMEEITRNAKTRYNPDIAARYRVGE